MRKTLGLPDFPWDTLIPAKNRAGAHPGGVVDLSVGTPVDPTPGFVQEALRQNADSPGYPLVVGTAAVRTAIEDWMERRGMVQTGKGGVVPTTGSKEMVAWLPRMLGIGPGDTVLFPDVAYPTYEVGALITGAEAVAVDQGDPASWPKGADLVWLNSPSNPTGAVLSADQLRAAVTWARENGAIVVADECYAELPWTPEYVAAGVPSLLHPEVCASDPTGLLVVYSLSKQSNMAGYRAGVLVGDPELVSEVVEVRKHGGMMVPAPVQAAMAAALVDVDHVAKQRALYAARREKLLDAVQAAGLVVSPETAAGLYLWVRAPDGWAERSSAALVDWFAERGILVAPGSFYGPKAEGYVRMALTATDERINEAVRRLKV